MVTGGAGRLGRAIAAAVVREGGRVILADRDKSALAQAAAALKEKSGCAAATVHGDVVARGRTSRACSRRPAAFDILVNAHGIFPNRPILEMTVEEWDQVFAVNVRGSMLTCRGAARRWTADGTKGAIVNISSGASRSARAGGSHYTGSKAAVNMMTEVLAIELGPNGIRVNAVLPGLVLDDVVTAENAERHPYINMMLEGHAARPHRASGRRRGGRGVPRLRPRRLDHRRDAGSDRRLALRPHPHAVHAATAVTR